VSHFAEGRHIVGCGEGGLSTTCVAEEEVCFFTSLFSQNSLCYSVSCEDTALDLFYKTRNRFKKMILNKFS
jgi:hypothetical protein